MKKIILMLILLIFISGCAEKPVLEETTEEEIQPIAEPEQTEEDVIEQMSEPELQEETIEPPDLTQLTSFKEQEGKAVDPDWSPDGSQIVFCLMEGKTQTLYLINTDGTGFTEIGPGFDPSWSPVKDKVAYTSNNQIYTMNSNGKEIIQLTTENSNANPAWSPDGTKIVYSYYEAGEVSIWIMNSDGSEKTPLTTSSDGECSLPSFSHDGSKIVYVKGPTWNTLIEMFPTKLNEIWVMNSDGSNKHMIYAPGDSYQWPFQRAWNKNNKILFLKNGILEDKLPKIFVINSDGTNPKQMVSPTMDSFGRPNYFYLDPVWDNTYTKVIAVRKIIDGPQNVVTFSWKE